MKIAICLLVVVFVISIEAAPQKLSRSKRGFRGGAADRFSHGFGKRTDADDVLLDEPQSFKRGFRVGAVDRFSHGFGKRENSNVFGDISNDVMTMTTEDLAELIQASPRLAYIFVTRYVDKNGDGVIDKEELFPEKTEQ